MGADDYVVKPFSLKELSARCRAALRRMDGGAAAQGYRDESFEVEFDSYVVRYRRPWPTGPPAARQVASGMRSRPGGTDTVKQAPLPGSLVTATTAPMLSATCFTMARPRPVPPSSRLRALSTR